MHGVSILMFTYDSEWLKDGFLLFLRVSLIYQYTSDMKREMRKMKGGFNWGSREDNIEGESKD